MNNRNIYFYNGKPPFYFIPLIILLTLLIIGVLAIFGFFIALAVGVVIIITGVMRFFSSFNKKKVRRMDPDGKTIILDDTEYEVLDSDNKNK